ncbi:hypothetical protein QBC32DRAFT_6194 [Pseudoneurospora amorphoporcata]|uniref:Uncharacterized protein n=1 Tax=Pseudoneurospora amorphoporcata TaxID=241081 RepID=A0AAN6NTM2_9PEZI|nr:hypothetical protein QBC32DRAFT_6194 [Pseudoneurospora amorphoporcata]
MTTFADSTVPASTASTIITTPTIATTAAMATSTTTAPKINSQSTHPTAASRHEIILLALGIFILIAQLALVIWVGVRRRRVSLSSSASGSSSTCAYHHSRWHRENCPRELDGLQLDGRGSHGHAHAHKGKCLWNGAFGESPTSPGGWRERTRGLRVGEDVEGQEEKEKGLGSSSGSGSGFDEDMGEGEGEKEGIGSRGNSVVIAGAQELMERMRKRSNSSGTFFKMIGAGEGQHVEGVPEDQTTVTRKRSDTFTMVLGRRFSGGGDSGLKERKGSAVNAAATTTAREGDVEMGTGKTSGLSTDFGGKFDGTEERNGGGSSSSSSSSSGGGGGGGGERRRGSWVQALRRYSGFGNQYGVQDPEKGGFGTGIPRELGDKAAVVGYLI